MKDDKVLRNKYIVCFECKIVDFRYVFLIFVRFFVVNVVNVLFFVLKWYEELVEIELEC